MITVKRADSWEVNQIPILDIVDEWGVERKRIGKYHLIICPNREHDDRHLGSCKIWPENNSFHCFACGAGGGPIDFVMNIEGIEFLKAKNLLARKYGLMKTVELRRDKITPRWTGLSEEEYSLFSLRNGYAIMPEGEEDGELIVKRERFTLRQLARENPELHDDILIGKFVEVAVYSSAVLLHWLESGMLFMMHDEDLLPTPAWKNLIFQNINSMFSLLEKGLVNKERANEVFSIMEGM